MVKQKVLPVQFQKTMIDEIEKHIEQGLYSSKAEFVREAVRKRIIELRKELFFLKAGKLKKISKQRGAKSKTPMLTKKQKQDIFKELKKS